MQGGGNYQQLANKLTIAFGQKCEGVEETDIKQLSLQAQKACKGDGWLLSTILSRVHDRRLYLDYSHQRHTQKVDHSDSPLTGATQQHVPNSPTPQCKITHMKVHQGFWYLSQIINSPYEILSQEKIKKKNQQASMDLATHLNTHQRKKLPTAELVHEVVP